MHKGTPKRRITVTSSFNEIFTDHLEDELWWWGGKGRGGLTPPAPHRKLLDRYLKTTWTDFLRRGYLLHGSMGHYLRGLYFTEHFKTHALTHQHFLDCNKTGLKCFLPFIIRWFWSGMRLKLFFVELKRQTEPLSAIASDLDLRWFLKRISRRKFRDGTFELHF